jgi:hypothetical protein
MAFAWYFVPSPHMEPRPAHRTGPVISNRNPPYNLYQVILELRPALWAELGELELESERHAARIARLDKWAFEASDFLRSCGVHDNDHMYFTEGGELMRREGRWNGLQWEDLPSASSGYTKEQLGALLDHFELKVRPIPRE